MITYLFRTKYNCVQFQCILFTQKRLPVTQALFNSVMFIQQMSLLLFWLDLTNCIAENNLESKSNRNSKNKNICGFTFQIIITNNNISLRKFQWKCEIWQIFALILFVLCLWCSLNSNCLYIRYDNTGCRVFKRRVQN